MIATKVHAIDHAVFHKYAGLSLPRHVSYPMPSWWSEMSGDQAKEMLRESAANDFPRPLSIYLHIPFCESLCKFCACNKVILRKDVPGAASTVATYVDAIEREIRAVSAQVDRARIVQQIHWGGGSPSYLEADVCEHIMQTIRQAFAIAEDAEIAMEIDPRHSPPAFLKSLRRMGFNRLSMGVQDFDLKVQEHIHRIQPIDLVSEVVSCARALGFPSVNFDLIYGLPYQTLDSVCRTVEAAIALSPDRVAFYHYAQIPDKIATQRGIHHLAMPSSAIKLQMFLAGIELFESAGYEFIGLDHFAKPDEMLAVAARDGRLQRNFQGMATGAELDLVGVGVSAISHLARVGFYQNNRDVDEYVRRINTNLSPVQVGKRLTLDDRIRQAVLNQLYCHAAIWPADIETEFQIDFAYYFGRELATLDQLIADGLVQRKSDGDIALTFPLGRVLMRTVAAVFDAYLDADAYRLGAQRGFSTNA
jgi:oxygen-independent coproporphyrinogen-3 oxidase